MELKCTAIDKMFLGIYWTVILLSFSSTICQGILIRVPPSNRSVVVGDDVTFTCDVRELNQYDYVFWKKVTRDAFLEVISYNNHSMNETKYRVSGLYDLTILDVQLEDEADYECQAGGSRVSASLVVAVNMRNISLVWNSSFPLAQSSHVNLTCRTHESRPPAEIRWFHGTDDITQMVCWSNRTFTGDGFGDSVSVLTVAIDSQTGYQPYRCVASLPGTNFSTSLVSLLKMAASDGMKPFPSITIALSFLVAFTQACHRWNSDL